MRSTFESKQVLAWAKPRIRIAGCLCILLLVACGPKPAVETGLPSAVDTTMEDEASIVAKAEEQMRLQQWEKARAIFNRYLMLHPQGPYAAEAHYHLAQINERMGEDERALEAYYHVWDNYRDQPVSSQAFVSWLRLLYRTGRYGDVVSADFQLEGLRFERQQLRQIFTTLGDAQLAVGINQDAVRSYTTAYNLAQAPHHDALISRLKLTLRQLDVADLVELLGYIDDSMVRGYLLFALGEVYWQNAVYDEAWITFSEFIQFYPEHEWAPRAQTLLSMLNQEANFKRHTIGCLLPLSGPSRSFGMRALNGIQLALSQANLAPGGGDFRIIIKDTGRDPQQTQAAVETLVAEGVAAIIGPIFTARVAAQIAQQHRIPIIAISQAENLPRIGDYVFRFFFTPRMQVETLVDYAVNALGYRRFAVLYPDDRYGAAFSNLFWDALLKQSATLVGLERYDRTHTDFADPIKKLVGLYYEVPEDLKWMVQPTAYNASLDPIHKDAPLKRTGTDAVTGTGWPLKGLQGENLLENWGASWIDGPPSAEASDLDDKPKAIVDFEAIFIPDEPKRVGLLAPQLAYYDIENVHLLGTNLWHSQTLIEMAPKYVQGALMTDIFLASSAKPTVRQFVNDYQRIFASEPGFLEAVAYDAAQILLYSLKDEDVRFRSSIRDRLLNEIEFEGATGKTAFKDDGEVDKQLFLIRATRRGFEEVPLSSAIP